MNKTLKLSMTCVFMAAYITLVLRRVFVGVHIDEEIIISTAYRWLWGDEFFIDIQEPQLLIAPLIGVTESIWFLFHESTEGIFLYMKTVTYISMLAVSVYMYCVLKKYMERPKAVILTLSYQFYHFRYVHIADYAFLFISASILCILLWMNYDFVTHKFMNACLAALSFFLMMICFPTAVLLFPFYFHLYIRKAGLKKSLFFLGVIMAAGVAELAVLFYGHALWEILQLIYMVVGNSMYAKDIYLKADRIIIICIGCFLWIFSEKIFSRRDESKVFVWGGISYAFLLLGLIELFCKVCFNLEYYNKSGYIPILIFGIIQIAFFNRREWIVKAFLWGIMADNMAYMMTRYDTSYIYAFSSLWAVIAILLFKCNFYNIRRCLKFVFPIIGFLFIEIFACDVLMISNNNHNGDTIFNQNLVRIERGPAKGAYARYVDVEKYNEIYAWIADHIQSPQKVCYFGKNVLLYLMSPYIEVSPPQLFMDYADKTVLENFYNQCPEKYPDIVILDISPTSKREIYDEERNLFKSYSIIYCSDNYMILRK